MSTLNLRVLIQAVDRITGPMRRISGSLDRFRGMTLKAGAALRHMTRLAGGAITALTGLAGVSMAGLGLGVLATGRTFERFRAQLEGTEGSSAAAKKSLSWIKDFASKTPYQLEEVMTAFIALRNQGIDPTSGALTGVGNLAAQMGKPLMQATEALLDAQTGDFERLKEFGIRARVAGEQVTLSYVKNNEEIKVSARNTSSSITAALEGIFDNKSAGSMDRLSKTMDGLWSNLMDRLGEFQEMIANAGVFDFVKGELAALLVTLDKLAKNGKLAVWAKEISDSMIGMFKTIKQATEGVDWVSAIKGVFGFIGGVAKLVKAIGGISGIITGAGMVAIGWLTTAAMGAGVAIGAAFGIAAAPIAAIIAGVGLLALTAWTVYRNWDGIWGLLKKGLTDFKSFLDGAWAGIKSTFKNGVEAIWRGLPPWFRMILQGTGFVLKIATDAVRNVRSAQNGQLGTASAGRPAMALQRPRPAVGGGGGQRTEVGGAIDIRIHSDGRPQVTRVQSTNPAVPVNTMAAYRGVNGR